MTLPTAMTTPRKVFLRVRGRPCGTVQLSGTSFKLADVVDATTCFCSKSQWPKWMEIDKALMISPSCNLEVHTPLINSFMLHGKGPFAYIITVFCALLRACISAFRDADKYMIRAIRVPFICSLHERQPYITTEDLRGECAGSDSPRSHYDSNLTLLALAAHLL